MKVKINGLHLHGEETFKEDEWTEELIKERKYLAVPLKKKHLGGISYEFYGTTIFKLEPVDDTYEFRFYKFEKDLTKEDLIDMLPHWSEEEINKRLVELKGE